jgi:hypothetical protein
VIKGPSRELKLFKIPDMHDSVLSVRSYHELLSLLIGTRFSLIDLGSDIDNNGHSRVYVMYRDHRSRIQNY